MATVSMVREAHNITLLVRRIIFKVDSYKSEAQTICAKIEREYQFLSAFKWFFFNHNDARVYYAVLPAHLTNEIKSICEIAERLFGYLRTAGNEVWQQSG